MDFKELLQEAIEAGKKALEACNPNPVGFYSADLNGNRLGPTTIENEGNCGGAYIRGIQYNSEIYKWFNKNAKKDGIGANASFSLENGTYLKKDVYKGYTLHLPKKKFYNGQSHERNKAFCDAAVDVLRSGGVSCRTYDYLT